MIPPLPGGGTLGRPGRHGHGLLARGLPRFTPASVGFATVSHDPAVPSPTALWAPRHLASVALDVLTISLVPIRLSPGASCSGERRCGGSWFISNYLYCRGPDHPGGPWRLATILRDPDWESRGPFVPSRRRSQACCRHAQTFRSH
ncbi:protein of unknown function [Candidatus Methylocalor cossyra]|uniref:Uncharacterized protein n=1 Tax=Candidatus Methylocalor cossyra TaxID=3108543 RepID=A0ABM9NL60_9GAMM